MAVLELENITGGYGETEILHGVSIKVEAGEVVVIIGPNGAGKSTAMKAVFGLLRLSTGRVLLDGEDITSMATEQVVRHGVCYVPQTANIFPSLTVEENLEMGAYVRKDDFRPRMAEIYDLFPPLAEKRRQSATSQTHRVRDVAHIGHRFVVFRVRLNVRSPWLCFK